MYNAYADLHAELLSLPLGGQQTLITTEGYSKRELERVRGMVTYFFQGHVEPHDNRIGVEGCEHISVDWDWRIEDQMLQNPDNPREWSLVLTKVPTPDRWKYSGAEMKRQIALAEAQTVLDALSD